MDGTDNAELQNVIAMIPYQGNTRLYVFYRYTSFISGVNKYGVAAMPFIIANFAASTHVVYLYYPASSSVEDFKRSIIGDEAGS